MMPAAPPLLARRTLVINRKYQLFLIAGPSKRPGIEQSLVFRGAWTAQHKNFSADRLMRWFTIVLSITKKD
jgi:hypothetical protein